MREVLLILLLFALTLGRCAVTFTVLQPTIDGVAHAWVRAETATDPIDDLVRFRQAERDGRAASKGKHGKPGQRYLAWRLSNSFSGPHIPLGRGRQRHLKRQLADLRRYGDAGNGHCGGACAEHFDKLSAGLVEVLGCRPFA